MLNTIVGGHLFPGVHHYSRFLIDEESGEFKNSFNNKKDGTKLAINCFASNTYPKESMFNDLEEASSFFERSSLGYSPARTPKEYQGLELKTEKWKVSLLGIESVSSSYFRREV